MVLSDGKRQLNGCGHLWRAIKGHDWGSASLQSGEIGKRKLRSFPGEAGVLSMWDGGLKVCTLTSGMGGEAIRSDGSWPCSGTGGGGW